MITSKISEIAPTWMDLNVVATNQTHIPSNLVDLYTNQPNVHTKRRL